MREGRIRRERRGGHQHIREDIQENSKIRERETKKGEDT